MHLVRNLALVALVSSLPACKSAYYGTMEAFGVHKRDILVDRVEEARDAQADAKEQFADALTAFKALENFDGGDLEKTYNKLKSEYDDSKEGVENVHSRIKSIEKVSSDLFKEWQAEIDQISNPSLRSNDEKLLKDTQVRYGEMISAMKKAEGKMEPVLTVFNDHVLMLKHNLNAQAIASLQGSLAQIESDVGGLIQEMERSISEADSFLSAMAKNKG